MSTKRLLLLAVLPFLAFTGCTCGSAPNMGDGGFALVGAYSPDGTKIVARFAKDVDPAKAAPAGFALTSDGGTVAQTVSSVAVDGGEVTLTLSGALPKGPGYQLAATNVVSVEGETAENKPVGLKGTLYLAMIWHQHQPVYIDPSGQWEWSRGPWVRKHATKDYYDMAAALAGYPDIHVQVNLTGVLLMQLQNYYIDRLAPYVNTANKTVDTAGYFAQRGAATEPVTDPWLDMLLQPTPAPGALTDPQRGWFWADAWSTFSISDVMIARFPAYAALRDKAKTAAATLTQDDLLNMKCWFELAWFDPRFLRGPVTLPDSSVVDLSDLISEAADGTFTLKQPFTEQIAQRLVVEEYKVLKNVVGIHRQLMYHADTKQGQIEVLTTPFYHPILPLLVDTDLTLQAMPATPMPVQRFQHADDADVHVAKAVKLYQDNFGTTPTGMWPGEGSVAEAVVPIFHSHGVRWIATDRKILEESVPGATNDTPYHIGGAGNPMAIVFRDTDLSDKIGFFYQNGTPEQNAADYIASLRKHAPAYGRDGLLSVILDGENAWEWYKLDNDGIGTLNAIYTGLTAAQQRGEVRTVTVSEFLDGNAARSIPAHPVDGLPAIPTLFAGSWISGSFSTWIGEDEENNAWDYLSTVRNDLATFQGQGLARPDPLAAPPAQGTPAWYAYKAWESMYAAEGSDWFWWYGSDQTAAGGDGPFDGIYRALLQGVYRNAQAAGISTTVPAIPSLLRVCNPPAGLLTGTPTIDGAFTPDDGNNPSVANEWTNAGSGVCQDVDTGITANPNDVIATDYYGASADSLYLALRMNENVTSRLGTNYQLRMYFSQKHIVSLSPITATQDPKQATTRAGTAITFGAGGAARELAIDFSGAQPAALLATTDGTSWGAQAAAASVQVAGAGTIVEMKIPLALLNWQSAPYQDPLEMLITAEAAGTELDRAPNVHSAVVFGDRSLMVEVTFILDATGTKFPLAAVSPVNNPPPPAGTGKAFIVGDQLELSNWTPNKTPMADDGTAGDETAGDNYWTFRMLASPGTVINYKYTIGSASQSWSGTEEFPMTNRGITVGDSNGDGKLVIRDIFADRPDPSGSLGPNTQILDP